MQRCSCVVLIGLLAVSDALGIPAFAKRCLQASATQESKVSVTDWARDNYNLVLDSVIPDHCAAPTDARWLSCIRIIPAFKDEMEYSLLLEKRYDGTLFARIVRPNAHSIYDQLCELKKAHPRATVKEAAELVEVQSQAGDQRRFPGLAGLADEFEKTQLSPALSGDIMMDPTEYRFHIKSHSGENMELTLHGPGAAAPHQPQGLIGWAESARELLVTAFK